MSDKILRVQNDVPTRWNSTLHMINCIIKLHYSINEFLPFINLHQEEWSLSATKQHYRI